MAFWGTEVYPGKPYTHRFDEGKGRLHISQATLGTGSSTKKSILQCNVGDKKPIYLCSFLPEKLETCPLNLEFEEDEEVIFSVVGPHGVHLSGFFLEKLHDDVVGEYDSDSYGEDIAETESDESSDYDSEEGYDDDFIVDDMDMFTRPAVKSGVVIEEIGDDEKPADQNGPSRREKKKQSSSTVDRDNSEHQLVVKGVTDPIVESEDDDGFPISSAPIEKVDAPSKKDDKKANAKNKIKAKNDSSQAKGLKRKAEVIDDEQTREKEHNSADENTEIVPESNEKIKKDKKKKKAKTNEEKVSEVGSQSTPIVMDKDKNVVNDPKSTGEKKKKKKKNKKETESNKNSEVSVTDKDSIEDKIEKSETKPYQSRTFPNGLVIDELKMGRPDAKKASPGKKVSVHYIGKLKKNEKIFDSNIGKAPFKFLLGVGQVIKGWDVGVNGMRVGDKRRITIPPAMGYGSKGAGGAIPPNSWLVFDVELVDVR